MRERVVFVVDAPDDQVGPLDRDALSAAISAATGLTVTCVGGGADVELPHEDIPGGPVWKDMPPIWAHVDVGAAMLDTAAIGRVPALYFRFYSPDGPEQQGVPRPRTAAPGVRDNDPERGRVRCFERGQVPPRSRSGPAPGPAPMNRENPPLIRDADIVAVLARWSIEDMDAIAERLRRGGEHDYAIWVEDVAWYCRRYLTANPATPVPAHLHVVAS